MRTGGRELHQSAHRPDQWAVSLNSDCEPILHIQMQPSARSQSALSWACPSNTNAPLSSRARHVAFHLIVNASSEALTSPSTAVLRAALLHSDRPHQAARTRAAASLCGPLLASLLGKRALLHAAQPHEINPQQAADERVGSAGRERECMAQAGVALKEHLDTALLDYACNDLVPQVARHAHVHAVRSARADHILWLVGRRPRRVQLHLYAREHVCKADAKHARAKADAKQLEAVAQHRAGALRDAEAVHAGLHLLECVVRAAGKRLCERARRRFPARE
mmetsp:Transcript_41303/g.123316  ORF Transcript_41303/g.123316 Transcript_41303/m.123316 type:complete len:279 (-) Transcript_41303:450-1286(-)